MKRLSRSTALKIAALLSLLISLYGFVVNIPLLAQGAAAFDGTQGPPYFIIVVLFALSIVGLLATYGVWHNQRWAIVLTILVAALNVLTAMPGVFFAPVWYWQLSSATITLFGIATIVCCLWRERSAAVV